MRLRDIGTPFIHDSKIQDYLLNVSHPTGRSKARFFLSFGYTIEKWERLKSDLLAHADNFDISIINENRFGTRYIIDCRIASPDGCNPRIRTAWIVTEDMPRPRLITAHPIQKRDEP